VSAARRAGVIAIDHGTKRTGFAVVDGLRITSQPLDVFHGPGDGTALLAHVAKLVEERDVDTFLVGLPLNIDGTAGARCDDVKRFSAALAARFPRMRVVHYDERLTTKAADEMLVESGHTGEARKARRDSWSALVLLRDWLASGEPD
jgi:putative Holliday junction resolvase